MYFADQPAVFRGTPITFPEDVRGRAAVLNGQSMPGRVCLLQLPPVDRVRVDEEIWQRLIPRCACILFAIPATRPVGQWEMEWLVNHVVPKNGSSGDSVAPAALYLIITHPELVYDDEYEISLQDSLKNLQSSGVFPSGISHWCMDLDNREYTPTTPEFFGVVADYVNQWKQVADIREARKFANWRRGAEDSVRKVEARAEKQLRPLQTNQQALANEKRQLDMEHTKLAKLMATTQEEVRKFWRRSLSDLQESFNTTLKQQVESVNALEDIVRVESVLMSVLEQWNLVAQREGETLLRERLETPFQQYRTMLTRRLGEGKLSDVGLTGFFANSPDAGSGLDVAPAATSGAEKAMGALRTGLVTVGVTQLAMTLLGPLGLIAAVAVPALSYFTDRHRYVEQLRGTVQRTGRDVFARRKVVVVEQLFQELDTYFADLRRRMDDWGKAANAAILGDAERLRVAIDEQEHDVKQMRQECDEARTLLLHWDREFARVYPSVDEWLHSSTVETAPTIGRTGV
jgi:hypothetical protein